MDIVELELPPSIANSSGGGQCSACNCVAGQAAPALLQMRSWCCSRLLRNSEIFFLCQGNGRLRQSRMPHSCGCKSGLLRSRSCRFWITGSPCRISTDSQFHSRSLLNVVSALSNDVKHTQTGIAARPQASRQLATTGLDVLPKRVPRFGTVFACSPAAS